MSIHNTCILGLSKTNGYPRCTYLNHVNDVKLYQLAVLHPIPLHDFLIHAGHNTFDSVYIYMSDVHACPLVMYSLHVALLLLYSWLR